MPATLAAVFAGAAIATTLVQVLMCVRLASPTVRAAVTGLTRTARS